MAGMTYATSGAYLDDSVGTANRTPPTTPMKLRVETVAGSATAAGTELASTTFPSIAFNGQSGTPPTITNNAQVTIVAGAGGTVVAGAVWDSAGTPVRKWYGPLGSNRTVVTGDSLVFASGTGVTLGMTSP